MKRIIIIVVGLFVLVSAASAFAGWEDFSDPEYFAGMAIGQTCGSIFGIELAAKMNHLGISFGTGLAYGDVGANVSNNAYFGYAITGKLYFNKEDINGIWLGLGYGTNPIIDDENDPAGLFALLGFTFMTGFDMIIQPSFGFHSLDLDPILSLVFSGALN